MQETNSTIKSANRNTHKLRVVHSPNRQPHETNFVKGVNGDPGVTAPKQKHYYSRAYSHDAVGGNYQGL
jgi:hypothetical protein